MGERRVAVLGGGVAGVVAAAELAKKAGIEVVLYERSTALGGLQHSISIDGASYDIGAFIFTADHDLFRAFPGLIDRFVPATPLHRSITPAGQLDDYPATLHGFVRDQGITRSIAALASLLYAKARYRKRNTLPALVRYYLGTSIYNRSGFRTYLERLYGLPDHEIDLEFAATRLYFLADVCSLRRRAARVVSRLWQRPRDSYDQPSVFVRPPEGFGAVYDAVREMLLARGVTVRTGALLERIERAADGGFVVHAAGDAQHFDRVVSTLPVAITTRLIGEAPPGGLEYMKLVSLFYRFSGVRGHQAAVICNLTKNGRWKRAVSFAELYGPHRGEEYFAVEVTTRSASAVDVAEADADFRRHTESLGLYRGTLTLQGSHVTEHAYPVYRVSEVVMLRDARRRLEDWGIDLLGRQGRFDYVTSSIVAANARAMADVIAEDRQAP
jgi:Phytoene dehydrogenase and related proteins